MYVAGDTLPACATDGRCRIADEYSLCALDPDGKTLWQHSPYTSRSFLLNPLPFGWNHFQAVPAIPALTLKGKALACLLSTRRAAMLTTEHRIGSLSRWILKGGSSGGAGCEARYAGRQWARTAQSMWPRPTAEWWHTQSREGSSGGIQVCAQSIRPLRSRQRPDVCRDRQGSVLLRALTVALRRTCRPASLAAILGLPIRGQMHAPATRNQQEDGQDVVSTPQG